MIQVEYVMSALGWGVIPNSFMKFPNLEELKVAMLEVGNLLHRNLAEKCQSIIPKISTLFNAFTEKIKVKEIQELNRMGFPLLYADSGGLQILTVGSEITPQIKDQIYRVQTNADFAFCFDEIPLKTVGERSRNERSNVFNKVFDAEACGPCGEKTAQNIKEQVELFQKLGAKTKVILICHGNTLDDFLRYYDSIVSKLEDHDYQNIGGIAIAKTGAGNQTREAIELVRVAKKISRNCHPAVKAQMHMLGVGAISKLRPLMYLVRSGYLTEYPVISYDSSSHTSCFDYGLLKINGGCDTLGETRTPHGVAHFKNVYQLFEPVLKNYLTVDEFLAGIYCGPPEQTENILDIEMTPEPTWPFSAIREKAFTNPNKKAGIIGLLSKTLHTYFVITNFCQNVDKLFREKDTDIEGEDATPMLQLKRIRDDKDIEKWIEVHSEKGKAVPSAKTASTEELGSTLERLFEE
jgi:hypothetical protein